MTPNTTEITLGHSPDPDDAFMHWALAANRIDTDEIRFRHILEDIETLNGWAREGRLHVTAISIHAYAYVHERYALLPHGASMGERYGPVVIAKQRLSLSDLRGKKIAVPGLLTTAYLALRLALEDFEPLVVPFDRIMEFVAEGKADAGLLIHEGQLTFGEAGFQKVTDLGEWWHGETGLPLPLGGNAIRKDLGELIPRISGYLRESILYGLRHREEALAHAEKYGRDLDRPLTDRFVGMYVNDATLDYGEKGRRAVEELLQRGYRAGLLPRPPHLLGLFVEEV